MITIMNTGKLQRKWSVQRPQDYDKENGVVCFDIVAEYKEENGEQVEGFSYYEVYMDTLPDYGNLKSQLIETGFAPKDEFGLLMNAVNAVIGAAAASTSWATFKSALAESEDVQKFNSFQEFRELCAAAARTVMANY